MVIDGSKKRVAVRDVPNKCPKYSELAKYDEHLACKNKALKKKASGNSFDQAYFLS